MAEDDGLTQREKRAQRHKVEARKGMPMKWARKAILPAAILLILAAVAAGFWYTESHTPDCPTHWHATFGVFVPTGDDVTDPQDVSFQNAYYDIASRAMPERAHMHQSDGFNQMHFEQAGTCVGVEEWMRYVEVRLSTSSIELYGHHQEMGQSGTWKVGGNSTLHAWVEANKDGTWTWEERSVKSVLGYQLKDGEKILVYIGNYSPDQVQSMKDSIHDPTSRQAGFVTPTGHPTATVATSSTASTSSASSTTSRR